MTGESVVQYVGGSSVRTDTLLAVCSGHPETSALLERVDASESAVYNALTALQRRDLVRSTDDSWAPTGRGTIVGAVLSEQRALGDLLEDEYWQTHDASPVPPQFRTSIGALAGCRVERASDADPYGLVREISRIITEAESVEIASPIYQSDYADRMPDSTDARLVLDESVIEETVESDTEDIEVHVFEETNIRLTDVDVALTVTDSTVVVSLPTLDGRYDPQTSVIAESDRAIEWGESLFEHYWRDATPVEEVIDLETI